MPEKEDRTLTGGIGNTPQDDRTLTGGISPPSKDDQTLTGGTSPTPPERPPSRGTRPSARTLTHTGSGGTGELVDKVNWEVGDIIDGIYEVVSVIGRGGKGIVYKINHLEWELELAVKMPLANLVSDETSKARFVREAQTWVDLGLHPNIVQCWYVRELGGIPRVFMDYIGGGSLKDWIRKGIVRPGEWDKILDMMIQACDGLGYAQEHGVEVHRDVKPGNMLLTQSGELLVTDFGIVKRGGGIEIEEEETSQPLEGQQYTITMTGSELGTPEYGAPEQWGKAKQADGRADIYALGGVLFELCCGRRPFDDKIHREPPHVLIGRHLSTPPPDPREFNKDIPDDLAELVLRCLAKKPEERPKSTAVLRENLVRFYDKLVGKNYRRPVPQEVKLRSDALNNRAVSMLDLGEKDEAFEAWKEALKLDPYHPESIYNRALLEWRECKITDDDVVRQLEATTHAGGRGKLYLGFIHLERAAADEAEEVLLDAREEPELATNAVRWRALGDAQMAQDKYEEAEESYQHTLEAIDGDFGSLEGQTLAQVKTRQRNGQLIFPWHHCYCAFEGGHESAITAIVISPNGRRALSGSQDTTLRLWDLTARACLWTAKGHEDEVSTVAITPDERFAVSGSRDRTLRLWDLATGKLIRVFRGHTDGVTAVAVTPNGRFIVSGSRDHTLRLWNIATGKCVWTSQKHRSWITAVIVTPNDGRFILSAHDEENLYLWDIATGKRVERKYYGSSLEGLGFTSSAVSALTITADGLYAVSGSQDKAVRLWNFKTGEVIRTYQGHDGNVSSVAVTSDGQFIVSGSDDATLRLWNSKTGECLWVSDPHEEGITAVAIDPNGQFVISGSQDKTLRQVDIKTGKSPWTLWGKQGHQQGVTSIAMAPRGRFAVSGGKDTTLQLWDIRTARCLRTFKGHPQEVTAVAITPDGQTAVSASRDATLWLWDLVRTKKLRTFEGHKKAVTALVTTPDGRFVISGSDDQTLRLWDLATAKCLRIFEGHKESITDVAVIPGERFIVSASKDKTLRLWDLATAKCLRIFEGHTASVTAVAVSPTVHFLVSGSDDRTLRLWDLTTAKSLKIFKGHKDRVTAVVVPPNERFVISAGKDKTLRLWDIETTRCLRTFSGHQQGVTSLAVTPEGQFTVSGSDDSTLRLWSLELDGLPHEASIQVCQQKSYSKVQSSTQRFRQQMAWAKAALETGKAVTAYKYLTHARSIPGYERAPELLTFSATLSKTLPRRSLRGKWLLWTLKGHEAGVTTVVVTPNGRFAISGSKDATLRMWDLVTAKCDRVFKGHKKSITAAVISPDGRFVVSGSEDTTLRLWDLATAKCLRTYEGHKKGVTATTMTQYGRFIVSGSKDSTLRVWNPSTTECIQTLKGHKQSIMTIAVTPDKRFIISGSEDKTLRLWDPTTTKCLQTLRGHKERVTAVDVTANGQFILSGSMDKTLRLWNISSGKSRRIFRGHENGVTSVVMTADARFAISGSKDKTLRLWNLITGECIWVFEQHKQDITTIAMTPDGRFVISGSEDKTLRQWELDWELDTKETTGTEEGVQSTGLVNRITSLFNK